MAAGIIGGARRVVLWLAALVTVGASLVALWESYHGLYLWAAAHRVEGPHLWPLCVDAFIVLGECALYVAMVDGWRTWGRVWPWVVMAGGLAVSVAANMGHVPSATVSDRLTFAVPPLAAFVGLTVGLGILKRTAAPTSTTAAAARPRAWRLAWSRTRPWVSVARVPRPSTTAAAGAPRTSSTAARTSSTAAAARPPSGARTSSTAAAARPAGGAPVPGRVAVAALVRGGVRDTGQLAQLTGLAERTARRYAKEAVGSGVTAQ